MVAAREKVIIEDLSLQYADGTESLRGISMSIRANAVTVLFGPAGGGKSTLLRCLNRLNDLTEVRASSGRVLMDGENILEPGCDVIRLRRRIGMVFARPVVLPMTIRENLTYGLELAGERRRSRLDEAVERSLVLAARTRYETVGEPAVALSAASSRGCVLPVAGAAARSFCDEPPRPNPISTAKVEAALLELKKSYTIVLVPHSVQQAARTADFAAFFLQGELVEFSEGKGIFTAPANQRTEDYVTGRFG
jgi:phosphate transport system ATP-binding protein